MNQIEPCPELTGSDPLVSAEVVRRELGDISDVTLRRHISRGLVPQPDALVRRQRFWLWSTVQRTKNAWIEGAA